MLKRLYIKFVCVNMAIVTVMLCVIFGTILHFTRVNLEEESLDMMRTMAMAPGPMMGRPDEMPQDVRLPFFVLEVGNRGEILRAMGGYFDLSDQKLLQELVAKVGEYGGNTGTLSEYNLRFFHTEHPNGQHRLVFADISSEIRTMNGLLRSCLLIGAGSFLVFLIISILLARWAVRPVEKAWEQQRQFVADASHELKTPLTVILTNAELLQSPDYDQETRTKCAEHVLAMSRQMRGLVESLLELARLDAASAPKEIGSVNLSKVVADAILPFEPVYFEQGLTLNSQIEEGLVLNGNEGQLRQVVEVLLDNAQKYSRCGGVVYVHLHRQRGQYLLAVSNPGPEILEEDRKNIFKRFYRVDKARSMNRSYGLGLPIAAQIVGEHKGKIWVESQAGINTFFVSLPI